MTQTREEYVQERMTRWRASAQCRCAAHVMAAERSFRESWDGLKKIEDWIETPEGQEWKKEFGRFVEQLQKAHQETKG